MAGRSCTHFTKSVIEAQPKFQMSAQAHAGGKWVDWKCLGCRFPGLPPNRPQAVLEWGAQDCADLSGVWEGEGQVARGKTAWLPYPVSTCQELLSLLCLYSLLCPVAAFGALGFRLLTGKVGILTGSGPAKEVRKGTAVPPSSLGAGEPLNTPAPQPPPPPGWGGGGRAGAPQARA